MNKVFRVLWSNALGCYVVTSELSKSKIKVGRKKLLSTVVMSIISAPGMAESIGSFNPAENDNEVGASIISNGNKVSLSGNMSNIAPGSNGGATMKSWQEMLDGGYVLSGQDLIGSDVSKLVVGPQNKSVSVWNPVTQSNQVVSVIDSATINTLKSAPSLTDTVALPNLANDQQYIGLRLATVDNTGGEVDLSLGDTSKSATDSANSATLYVKQSSLIFADGSGTADSTANWTSKNNFTFAANTQPVDGSPSGVIVQKTTFAGTFTAFDGSTHTVTNAAELQQYNDWLIAQLKTPSSALKTESAYTTAFRQAIKGTENKIISYKPFPDSAVEDELSAPKGFINVIRASGSHGKGTLAAGGELIVEGSVGGIMRAENGAAIINDGMVSRSRMGNFAGDGIIMSVNSGATGINNGVINSNLTLKPDGSIATTGITYTMGAAVSDAASTFANKGVINVASTTRSDGGVVEGIRAGYQGVATNAGNINVGVGGTTISNYGSIGARVIDYGSFTNEATGEIYIGRGPQTSVSDASADIALSVSSTGKLAGILADGSAKAATNNGTITIGTLTSGASAMDARRTTATVTNNGTINILGAAPGLPPQNIGMLSTGSTNVTNSGTINVGMPGESVVNAVALKAFDADNLVSKISSNGIVNINGKIDPATGIRNYGLWVDGSKAEGNLTGGEMNLRGEGAIGAHAVRGGTINLKGGLFNFVDGKDQIGFFSYGEGSAINILSYPTGSLDVSTENSTLFRIEDGATINNSDDAKLVASGKNSVAILATGQGSTLNYGSEIDVSGTGAVGMRIEGGAKGTISNTASINLLGKNAVAGVVDGNYYGLDKRSVAEKAGASELISHANLTTGDSAENVYGYVILNNGKLTHNGTIDFTKEGSTGVLIGDGTLVNNNKISVNGTAVHLLGGDSNVISGGTVTATDGTAAYLVGAGASLNLSGNGLVEAKGTANGILLEQGAVALQVKDATITMDKNGTGNGIENKAEIAGIQLTNTTINTGSGAGIRTGATLAPVNSGIINVEGSGEGILFEMADGSTTANSLDLTQSPDLLINVNAAEGKGLVTNTSADVKTGINIKVNHAEGGPALMVKGNSSVIEQSGTLESVSDTNPVVDVITDTLNNFVNTGSILAKDALQVAVQTSETSSGINFTNEEGAVIRGKVNLRAGDNLVTLKHGSQATEINTGNGNDIFLLKDIDATDTRLFTTLNAGAGNDTLELDNSLYTLTDPLALTGFEKVWLKNASSFTLGDSENPIVLDTAQVVIDQSATLSGFGGVSGDVNNAGLLQLGTGSDSPVQDFTLGGSLINSGNVMLGAQGQAPGSTLTVKGNYHGDSGTLHFNTQLGADDSLTDKMVVEGNTSGETLVSVTNAGGKGASTLNGIELIHVNGKSEGQFKQKGRIVAGAFDYSLVRGKNANAGNWYLSNHKDEVIPQPEPQPQPEQGGSENSTPNIRPEAGSYIANLHAANTMFNLTLHDRLGETQYIDALTGEKKVTSMWLRQEGGHNRWHDTSGQLSTQSNRYVAQLGGDIAQWSSDGLDRLHLGIMAGYGNNHNNTKGSFEGYNSRGSVEGYSVGGYATWYGNDNEHQGAYVDTWVQYNWFDNHVNGEQLAQESYKSKGFTASLETGYTHKLGEFAGSHGSLNEWYIQPQAQAVWMGVSADDHRETNGTLVQSQGDGNVMTRLGVRTYIKGHHKMDDGKQREFQPFVEMNWLHNTKDFSTSMDGYGTSMAGTKNMGEMKVGVEGQINPKLNVWGNTTVRLGDEGYSDTSAMVGVKYNF